MPRCLVFGEPKIQGAWGSQAAAEQQVGVGLMRVGQIEWVFGFEVSYFESGDHGMTRNGFNELGGGEEGVASGEVEIEVLDLGEREVELVGGGVLGDGRFD